MGASVTTILRRILTAGLVAGLLAGTVITAAQMLQVTPLILAAETYEQAAGHHQHQHEQGTPASAHHAEGSDGWAPEDGLERAAFTWLANVLTGAGFGLLLAAAMGFAGRPVEWRRGMLWGVAGYGAFAVAPALGLPPELPGMVAADLPARQMWWLMAAGGTAAGLALMVFARRGLRRPLQLAGLVLILLPHLFGAPHAAIEQGPVPAELAARFAVASLAASALFWVVLGAAVGHFMSRVIGKSEKTAKIGPLGLTA